MEKNNKKTILKTIVVLTTVFTILLAISVPIFATDTYVSNFGVKYSDEMNLQGFEVTRPTDYGIGNSYSYYVKSPSEVIYNTQSSFDKLTVGSYINYPIQVGDDATSTGGRIHISDVTYSDMTSTNNNPYNSMFLLYRGCISPLKSTVTPGSASSRNIFSGESVKFYFGEFRPNVSNDRSIYSTFTYTFMPNFIDSQNYTNYEFTYVVNFEFVYYDLADRQYKNSSLGYVRNGSYENIGDLNTAFRGRFTIDTKDIHDIINDSVGTYDCIISNMDVRVNYKHNLTSNDYEQFITGDRIYYADIELTSETRQSIENDAVQDRVNKFYTDHINYVTRVDYINTSFVGWIIESVGGFFDFEIITGISLGGILLVVVSLSIFVFILRVLR